MKAYRGPARRGAGPGEGPRGFKAWFREQLRRTSCITVLVAGLSLFATLGLGLWNISLQIGRPEMEPAYERTRLYEEGAEWRGELYWRNGGKQSATSLFVTVYVANKEGRRLDKLWSGFCEPPVSQSSSAFQNSIVTPSNAVTCGYRLGVANLPPEHLLICAAYLNESGKKYRQAFQYGVLPAVRTQTGGQPRRCGALSRRKSFHDRAKRSVADRTTTVLMIFASAT